MSDPPETTAELLPKRLYLAELAMLPFFWLAPLALLVLGGATALDVRHLRDEYDIHPGDERYVWYLLPFVLSHVGTFIYRSNRHRMFARSLGLKPSDLTYWAKDTGPPAGRPVRAWTGIQLVALVIALIVPVGAGEPYVGFLFVGVFAANAIVGPALVWRDLRAVREMESVEWGWSRFLHVLVAAFPFAVFVYFVQRREHTTYAAIIAAWNAPEDEREREESDRTAGERLADWFDAHF